MLIANLVSALGPLYVNDEPRTTRLRLPVRPVIRRARLVVWRLLARLVIRRLLTRAAPKPAVVRLDPATLLANARLSMERYGQAAQGLIAARKGGGH